MRRSRRGLRTRVAATTAVVAAVAMTMMIATVVLVVTALTHNSVDSTLQDRLALLSHDISTGADGATTLETPDDAIDDSTWLFDARGSELDGPRAGPQTQSVARGLATVAERTRIDVRDRIYLAGPITIRGSGPARGVLVVSRSLEPYEQTRLYITLGLLVLGLLVVAGATAISAITVDRALRPVEAMADLADDWSERALDARFEVNGQDGEFAHLGQTLNVLLDRVAGALRNEQRLTSELAHELRTPLTAIRGEAELGLMASSPASPGSARLEEIVALSDRMGETITVLLAIARGHEQVGTRSWVGDVVQAAVACRPAADARVTVTPVPTDVWVAAPTEMAVRALCPLLDNAVQHAVGSITVRTDVFGRLVTITVSDDGPGVPLGDPELLFRAGHRAQDGVGAGLGLSLARRVAHTLGGEVGVTSRRAPTSFSLTIPRY